MVKVRQGKTREERKHEQWHHVLQHSGGGHATGGAVLELVRLNGATHIHHLKRKGRRGHVTYWKAQCGETRPLRLDGGKERKLLPIRTSHVGWGQKPPIPPGRTACLLSQTRRLNA